jgi:leucyl/phenylalanyl-tRNA--protein transferase
VTIRLPALGPEPDAPFPPVEGALRSPDGLLAFGGDLSVPRLVNAYRHGIFPWYSRGEPILWWSPDPRFVFDTVAFGLPRRFRRSLRCSRWTISADRDFDAVVAACARAPRPGQRGTWITAEMQAAYLALHRAGHAHSIEIREDERLVGGLYGVVAGPVFCGESMFSLESGGSKVALAALCRQLAHWGVRWLDAQVGNPHLERLGARAMPRAGYLAELQRSAPPALAEPTWAECFAVTRAAELA